MPNFTRVMFIRHKQKEILQLDFSECLYEELMTLVTKSRDIISQQPPNSLLVFTNLADIRINKDVAKTMREYLELNKPFIKASAVIGITSQTQVLFNTIITLARREIKVFDNEAAAKDWLVEQK